MLALLLRQGRWAAEQRWCQVPRRLPSCQPIHVRRRHSPARQPTLSPCPPPFSPQPPPLLLQCEGVLPLDVLDDGSPPPVKWNNYQLWWQTVMTKIAPQLRGMGWDNLK